MTTPLATWMERLDGVGMDVKAAADFDAALAELRRDTVFVLRLADEAQAPGGESQRIVQRVATVYGLRNFRDETGERAVSELDRARGAVRGRLLGWRPGRSGDQVQFAGGRMMALEDRELWWQDEWLLPEMVVWNPDP